MAKSSDYLVLGSLKMNQNKAIGATDGLSVENERPKNAPWSERNIKSHSHGSADSCVLLRRDTAVVFMSSTSAIV